MTDMMMYCTKCKEDTEAEWMEGFITRCLKCGHKQEAGKVETDVPGLNGVNFIVEMDAMEETEREAKKRILEAEAKITQPTEPEKAAEPIDGGAPAYRTTELPVAGKDSVVKALTDKRWLEPIMFAMEVALLDAQEQSLFKELQTGTGLTNKEIIELCNAKMKEQCYPTLSELKETNSKSSVKLSPEAEAYMKDISKALATNLATNTLKPKPTEPEERVFWFDRNKRADNSSDMSAI